MQIGKCLSDRGQDIFLHKSSSDLYVLSEIFELISPEKSFTQSYKMLFYSFTWRIISSPVVSNFAVHYINIIVMIMKNNQLKAVLSVDKAPCISIGCMYVHT